MTHHAIGQLQGSSWSLGNKNYAGEMQFNHAVARNQRTQSLAPPWRQRAKGFVHSRVCGFIASGPRQEQYAASVLPDSCEGKRSSQMAQTGPFPINSPTCLAGYLPPKALLAGQHLPDRKRIFCANCHMAETAHSAGNTKANPTFAHVPAASQSWPWNRCDPARRFPRPAIIRNKVVLPGLRPAGRPRSNSPFRDLQRDILERLKLAKIIVDCLQGNTHQAGLSD